MKPMLSAMLRDDSGQGLVEYSLILLLVAIVAITALTVVGRNANNRMNVYGSAIPD